MFEWYGLDVDVEDESGVNIIIDYVAINDQLEYYQVIKRARRVNNTHIRGMERLYLQFSEIGKRQKLAKTTIAVQANNAFTVTQLP